MLLKDVVTGVKYEFKVVPAGEDFGGFATDRETVFIRLRDRWMPLKGEQYRFVIWRDAR